MSDHIKRGKQVELLDALQVERARYVEQRSASRALAGNRLSDGAGLFLFVTPNNAKSWRFEYRYPKGGKRHILVYGSFPDLSLAEVRRRHAQARLQLADGLNPAEERVERWIGWANDDIGTRPLPEVEAGDVLAIIKRVSDRGNPASAEFCRQTISRVFNYGIRTLRAPRGFNPAEAVKGAIIVPEKRHRPKLGANQLPAFLADLDKYQGPEAVKIGIKILLHCFLKKPLDTGRLLQVVALFTPNPA